MSFIIHKSQLLNKPTVTAAATDKLLAVDASDSDNLKIVSAQSVADLASSLHVSTTAVGNVGSGEDNLMTYALDAGKLATDGDRLFIRMSFTYADNANAKRIRVYFGTDVCFDTTSLAFQNGKVVADIEIIRTGATAQLITSGVWQRFVLGAVTYTPAGADIVTGTQTLSSSVTIKATGEATSNDDIVQKSVSIMYYPYG